MVSLLLMFVGVLVFWAWKEQRKETCPVNYWRESRRGWSYGKNNSKTQ